MLFLLSWAADTRELIPPCFGLLNGCRGRWSATLIPLYLCNIFVEAQAKPGWLQH
jgi:hypothetical protein